MFYMMILVGLTIWREIVTYETNGKAAVSLGYPMRSSSSFPGSSIFNAVLNLTAYDQANPEGYIEASAWCPRHANESNPNE